MSPGETVAHSIRALSSQLDEIQKYVDAVVRGDLTASRDVGIALSEALNSLSKRFCNSRRCLLVFIHSSNIHTYIHTYINTTYIHTNIQKLMIPPDYEPMQNSINVCMHVISEGYPSSVSICNVCTILMNYVCMYVCMYRINDC